MTLPTVSVNQPPASLLLPLEPGEDPVMSIMTRNWPAPKSLIGQRLGIASTKREPTLGPPLGEWTVFHNGTDNEWVLRGSSGKTIYLLLGHLLGTVRVVDCAPIGEWDSFRTGIYEGDEGDYPGQSVIVNHAASGFSTSDNWQLVLDDGAVHDISDQLPYGDYTPGRWAWIFEDAKTTGERCPACRGTGRVLLTMTFKSKAYEGGSAQSDVAGPDLCPTCNGKGTCDPIPVKGSPRIWQWSP